MVTSSKVTQPCHDGDSSCHDQLLSSGLPVCPLHCLLPSSQLRGDSRPWFHRCLPFSMPHLTTVVVHNINRQGGERHHTLWARSAGLNPLLCGPPSYVINRQTWTQSSPLIASLKVLGQELGLHLPQTLDHTAASPLSPCPPPYQPTS